MSSNKRWECQSCQAIVEYPSAVSASNLKCLCGNPDWRLLSTSYTDQDLISARSAFHGIYKDLITLQKQYLDMPEDYSKVISIWIIGTYLHSAFDTYPFLFFNAMRGSGKTRALKFISSLGALGDGSVQNNISDAALFRIPQGTTTCIDEVEQIGSKEKSTLRELLNAAYKRGIKVKRVKKVKKANEENFITEEYEPFIPLAMANIWGVEEVLGDRSITLILEKSNNPGVTKKIEDFQTNPIFNKLKRTLGENSVVMSCCYGKKQYKEEWNDYINEKYNNTTTHIYITTLNNTTSQEDSFIVKDFDKLLFFNKIDEAGISGRNFELTFPLLITSKLIHDEVFDDILEVMKRLVTDKRKDEYAESKDVSLYSFISTLDNYSFQYISVKDLTFKFREFIGEEDDQDRWLNEKWMGKALKRLKLFSSKKRDNKGHLVILDIPKAKEKTKIFKMEESDD